jgi:hypothetical protein
MTLSAAGPSDIVGGGARAQRTANGMIFATPPPAAPPDGEMLLLLPWWSVPLAEAKAAEQEEANAYRGLEKKEYFRPDAKAEKEGGQFVRALPESIYTALPLVLQWLTINPGPVAPRDEKNRLLQLLGPRIVRLFGRRLLLTLLGGALPALLLSYALQLGFGSFLVSTVEAAGSLGGDIDPACTGGDAWLRLIANAAFLLLVIRDLLDSIDIHLWIALLPPSAGPQMLMFQTCTDLDTHGQYADTEIAQPASGLTGGERALFYVVVIVGKLAVALLILVGGTGLVLRAGSNYDLVLNAVAAVFVLELDEAIYQVLVPNSLKKTSGGMPPLGLSRQTVEENPKRYEILDLLSFWIKAGLIAVLHIASMACWCAVPDAGVVKGQPPPTQKKAACHVWQGPGSWPLEHLDLR